MEWRKSTIYLKPNIMINVSFALVTCSAKDGLPFVGRLLWGEIYNFCRQITNFCARGNFFDFRTSIQLR